MSSRTPRRRDALGALVVVVGVLFANASYLSGFTSANPLVTTSGLASVSKWGLFHGLSSSDPNVGYTTQALGHLAASLLLHGHLPYWNLYEGLGAPLLGEMQSAAFFPFAWLLVFANGVLLLHLSLELLAGIATFTLLRYMGLSRVASTVGGLAFAINGSFAWLANSAFNPVALLPVCILGVELCLRSATRRHIGGWVLLAVALGLSFDAGFPEVAFFDTLLAIVWALVRLAGTSKVNRFGFIRRLGTGAVCGVLLAAPAAVAFLDALRVSGTSTHSAGKYAHFSLHAGTRPLLLDPYAYGVAWLYKLPGSATLHIGSIGGFLSIAAVMLASIAVFSSRDRPLRIALALWAACAVLATYGLLGVHQVFDLVPGVSSMALGRYIPASFIFAVVFLAACGLDDLGRGSVRRGRAAAAGAIGVAATVWALVEALPLHRAAATLAHNNLFMTLTLWWPLAIACLVAAGLIWLDGRRRVLALGALMVLDAGFGFMVPTTVGPQNYQVDMSVVHYLQDHLGTSRFYSIEGAFAPNYGSYFGLSQIDVNDLPVPQAFLSYVPRELDTNVSGYLFTGYSSIHRKLPPVTTEFLDHIANFEQAGVRYLVTPRNSTFPSARVQRLYDMRPVYRDSVVAVYELAHATAFFSGPGCTYAYHDQSTVRARCAHAATLERLELNLPGWTATVNAHPVPIIAAGSVFQSVSLPSGESTIVFSYVPPHEGLAWDAFAVGLIACFGVGVTVWWRRRSTATDDDPELLDESDERVDVAPE